MSTRRKRLPKELVDEVETPGNIFELSEEEKKARLFHLRYSAREDVYYRYGQRGPVVKGWKEGAFIVVNMQRYYAKKEPDIGEWTYLTRKPRHSSGSISWFIDLSGSGLVIDQVYALTFSRTMSGGNITYDLKRPDCPSRKKHKTGSSINGLIFVAYLDGGLRKRERAQTQLFYQDCLDDPEGFPFDLLITLKPPDPEDKTKRQTTESGPLPPLSFPPKPHIMPKIPPRCTCLHNGQGPHTSASVANFRDDTRCYEQDERDIIASEKKGGTEISPNGLNTCSGTKEVNGNGSVLLTDPNGRMGDLDATLANPNTGKVIPTKDSYNGRMEFERGDASNLRRTERVSETSKCPEDGISRRFSETSRAWEQRGIDQENLVDRRRKSRCVIL